MLGQMTWRRIGWGRLENTATIGGEHCGEFGLRLQLLTGVADVAADGVRTQVEIDGDLFGPEPQSHQAQDLYLTGSQGTSFATDRVGGRVRWHGWGLPFREHTLDGYSDSCGPCFIEVLIEQVY